MKRIFFVFVFIAIPVHVSAECETCPDLSSVLSAAGQWPQVGTVQTLIEQLNFVETCMPEPSFVSPEPKTTLTGSSVTVEWEYCGVLAEDAILWIGSGLGLSDLYNSGSLGMVASHMVTGLPQTGQTLYVRLTYSVGGMPFWVETTYQAGNSLCVLDSDNDRLPDCVETNTGIFLSPDNTGTDPMNPDTDGDGIEDGDEVLGTLEGLDLPALGTNPLRENILLEYDWFDDNSEPAVCGAHSHRPTPEVAERVRLAFANSPRINPDGSTGVTVIQDYGQGGAFLGGNLVPDDDGVIAGTVSGSDFQTIKTNHFADNRRGYFHYVLFPHRYNTNSGSSGVAEILGDDLIVSLYCFGTTNNVSNTIMHELGHNLNLRHGGNENCNYKPNYNSVMNYRFQFPGVDADCDATGDGVLDYSHGDYILLNEMSLNENNGVCGSQLIDWNGNSVPESSISFDINVQGNSTCNLSSTLTILRDFDDWANISFLGLEGLFLSSEVIECENEPLQ